MGNSAQNNPRLPELDGIRGVAISLVVFQHYARNMIEPGRSWLGDFFKSTFNLGWSGVDLFFVLSGFLIGGILMDNRKAENYFRTFYLRRFCRILPPYLLTLAGFYLALNLFRSTYSSQEWFFDLFAEGRTPPCWINLTFTQNIFHAFTGRANGEWLIATWTLAVEEQFYLMLPLMIWLLKPSRLMPILILVVLLYPGLLFLLLICKASLYDFFVTAIPVRGDALLLGVVCAFVVRQASWWAWLRQNKNLLYGIFLGLLVGMGYVAPRYHGGAFMYDQVLVYNHVLDLFYACLLLLTLAHRNGILAITMRFAPLQRLGVISYSLYLFHMPVVFLCYGLILGRGPMYREYSDIFITLLALLVSLILAEVSWRFMEKPIVAWGHSFHYAKGKNVPVVGEEKVLAQS